MDHPAAASEARHLSSVYTVGLGNITTSGPGDHVVFTVPSSGTTVLRDILAIGTGAATDLLVIYWSSGSNNATLIREPLPDSSRFHWSGRQVLPNGAAVHVNYSGPGAAVSFTGYQFSS